MATSRVDQKNRIVIDKRTRAKTHLKAGDTVIIEPSTTTVSKSKS